MEKMGSSYGMLVWWRQGHEEPSECLIWNTQRTMWKESMSSLCSVFISCMPVEVRGGAAPFFLLCVTSWNKKHTGFPECHFHVHHLQECVRVVGGETQLANELENWLRNSSSARGRANKCCTTKSIKTKERRNRSNKPVGTKHEENNITKMEI